MKVKKIALLFPSTTKWTSLLLPLLRWRRIRRWWKRILWLLISLTVSKVYIIPLFLTRVVITIFLVVHVTANRHSDSEATNLEELYDSSASPPPRKRTVKKKKKRGEQPQSRSNGKKGLRGWEWGRYANETEEERVNRLRKQNREHVRASRAKTRTQLEKARVETQAIVDENKRLQEEKDALIVELEMTKQGCVSLQQLLVNTIGAESVIASLQQHTKTRTSSSSSNRKFLRQFFCGVDPIYNCCCFL